MIRFPASYVIKILATVLILTLGLLLYIYAQGGVSHAIYPRS